jgi:hypothetical protein
MKEALALVAIMAERDALREVCAHQRTVLKTVQEWHSGDRWRDGTLGQQAAHAVVSESIARALEVRALQIARACNAHEAMLHALSVAEGRLMTIDRIAAVPQNDDVLLIIRTALALGDVK